MHVSATIHLTNERLVPFVKRASLPNPSERFLNLIRQHPPCGETCTRRGQAVSPQHNTLLETVVSMTLVVIVEMIEFGDSNPWTAVH
jgi:hypothetical protein